MKSHDRPDIKFQEDDHKENQFLVVSKENPMFPVGLAGFVGIIAWRIFRVRKRDRRQPFHFYVIGTRLYAQGFLVACASCIMFYDMGRILISKYITKKPVTPIK